MRRALYGSSEYGTNARFRSKTMIRSTTSESVLTSAPSVVTRSMYASVVRSERTVCW